MTNGVTMNQSTSSLNIQDSLDHRYQSACFQSPLHLFGKYGYMAKFSMIMVSSLHNNAILHAAFCFSCYKATKQEKNPYLLNMH